MAPILELLVETLLRRFSDSGFDVPQSMTEKDREAFVINTLETAVILAPELMAGLLDAAREVLSSWERGDLAAAVRNLSCAVDAADRGVAPESPKPPVLIICQGGLVQEVVGLGEDQYEICDCDAFEDRSSEAKQYFDALSDAMKNYLRSTGWNKELPKSRRDSRSQL